MLKEYCRVSIDESNYQRWLEEDITLEELQIIEQEACYDADKTDQDE